MAVHGYEKQRILSPYLAVSIMKFVFRVSLPIASAGGVPRGRGSVCHRTALVHRAIALRDLVERQGQSKTLPGLDLPVPHLGKREPSC
jgi:hypothetical protein